MNRERLVLAEADVLVQDGRIARVGRVPKGRGGVRQVVDARGKAVIPGLIHGHIHTCQTLFRGRADGLELLDWLRERIWPFEAAHDAASMRASADLSFAELIRSGATAALDMGTTRHYEEAFESAKASGFRLVGGKAMMDAGQGVPKRLRETTEESLRESLALLERYHGTENGRLQYAFAPRFVLSCSEKLLREVAREAAARKVRIHTHASENPTECDVVRQKTGKDNISYFHELGMSGPHCTFAHCVWPTAEEQRILRETGTVVTHCPGSNLKLASGIAKIPELMDSGVTVALGADGAPCNNNLDMFVEMRLAGLLHKPRCGPLAMPAMRVLEMATINGAKSIGQEADVGSLEEGKRADITVVDLSGLHVQPLPPGGDALAEATVGALVYAARSNDVTDVFVEGRALLRDRVLMTLDETRIRNAARTQSEKLHARA